MLLGSPQNLRSLNGIQVEFRGHHLVPISEAKNLGIIFDQSLSWDRQVSSVTQRCFGVLTGLSHLRGHLPTAVLSALINALVFSQICYGISVYGNGKKGNLNRLQKVVNYAAKVLFGRRKYDHVSDLLGRLGWLSAEGMATYHTLCLLHKVRRYGEPERGTFIRPNYSCWPEVALARVQSVPEFIRPLCSCWPEFEVARSGQKAAYRVHS